MPSYNAFRWHFVKYHKVKDASDDQELYEGFYKMVDDVNVKDAVGQKMIKDGDFWTCKECDHRAEKAIEPICSVTLSPSIQFMVDISVCSVTR